VWGNPPKKSDRGIMKKQKQSTPRPRMTKWATMGHKTRLPDLTPHLFAPSFVHGLVHISYFLFSYILLSVSN
jgi:hypothetical protein